MDPHLLLQKGLERLEGLDTPEGLERRWDFDVDEAGNSQDTLGMGASFSRYLDMLERFLDELEMWNRRVRLISGDRGDIVVRHLLDSLAVYPVIRDLGIKEIADIGSGNGFPAIPLALRDETLRFSLVERGTKKAAFLRNAVGILNLGTRLEVLDRDVGEVNRQFPLVISRAFMPISSAVPLLKRIVGGKGILLFFAGKIKKIETELEFLEQKTGVRQKPDIIPVEVPFLEEERHLCLFRNGGGA